jgi:hypothetical protein
MRMNRVAALTMGAGLITMAACSDAPTATPAAASFIPRSSFEVLPAPTPAVELGKLIICKGGNVGGTFNLSNQHYTGHAPDGNPPVASSVSVLNGECKVALEDQNPVDGDGSNVTVTEETADFTTQSLTTCKFQGAGGPVFDCSVATTEPRFVNAYHGFVVTYTNTFDPPEPPADVCDFSTFGGFVLTPNNVSYGGNAGFASSGFAYGSLNFVNHTNGDHIHVWNVTDYGHPSEGPLSQYADSRLAYGLGSINGGPVNVPVEWRFVDLGEPAKKKGDAVYLKIGTGDDAVVLIPELVVIGGNIQLHAKCKKAPKAEKH